MSKYRLITFTTVFKLLMEIRQNYFSNTRVNSFTKHKKSFALRFVIVICLAPKFGREWWRTTLVKMPTSSRLSDLVRKWQRRRWNEANVYVSLWSLSCDRENLFSISFIFIKLPTNWSRRKVFKQSKHY